VSLGKGLNGIASIFEWLDWLLTIPSKHREFKRQ